MRWFHWLGWVAAAVVVVAWVSSRDEMRIEVRLGSDAETSVQADAQPDPAPVESAEQPASAAPEAAPAEPAATEVEPELPEL